MKNRLIQIAQEAGAFFRRDALTDVVSKEGHANYVTNIDCKVQEFLEKELLQLLPGSEFIGEEKENQALTDVPTWIVDPLDGTTNMIHDYRMSAVSIALCRNKKPVIGVIWQPFTQELFYAEEGAGAFLNDRPIHVSDTPFRNALVAFGTAPYYEELEDIGMKLASEYLHQCADIRRSGSAALDLTYLACGRHDIFFELRLKPWDYAAGSLIVQEAGGLVQMPLAGGEMDYNLSTAILSANPLCMPMALEVFNKTVPKEMPGLEQK
ncbi:MAG: inositol monophosphatase [Clostridia bacterium]|nr:inositol monophosphatase [Clostridia bacterium]